MLNRRRKQSYGAVAVVVVFIKQSGDAVVTAVLGDAKALTALRGLKSHLILKCGEHTIAKITDLTCAFGRPNQLGG